MYRNAESIAALLDRRLPEDAPFGAAALSGGVSSLVFMAHGATGRRVVVKQMLAELAVAEHWPAPRERVFNECRAMRAARDLIGPGSVPEVLFEEPPEFLYAMEAVPERAVLLKRALLDGLWEEGWLGAAGGMLADLHRGSAGRAAELESRFRDISLLESLRLDPYFRHAARVRPDLAGLLERAAETARNARRALVHDDFSPKNIFVLPDEGRLILLDFEGAHWGNPSFDAAFFLTHPLAKSLHLPAQAARLAEGIRQFWRRYSAGCGPCGAREDEVLLLWGAIAIARVIGKSPLEYLADDSARRALIKWGSDLAGGRVRGIMEAADRIGAGG